MFVARNRILSNYSHTFCYPSRSISTLHKSLSLHRPTDTHCSPQALLNTPIRTKGTSTSNKKNKNSKLSYKQRNQSKSSTMMSDTNDGTDPNRAEPEPEIEIKSDAAVTGIAVVSNEDKEKRTEDLDEELNAVGCVTSIVLQNKETNVSMKRGRSCVFLCTLFDSY
jgi:hypothetical protein